MMLPRDGVLKKERIGMRTELRGSQKLCCSLGFCHHRSLYWHERRQKANQGTQLLSTQWALTKHAKVTCQGRERSN